MYRFAKAAVNATGQSVRQVRHVSQEQREFHAKYGTANLLGGVVFCAAVWTYVATQTGITWYPSPVGRVMPKPWRENEK